MGKTYAIADLHGRYDLLVDAYGVIANHAAGDRITVVHLGDYIDRGPQSREIIEFLMDPATLPDRWKRVCLKGNHEAIMCAVGTSPGLMGWWIQNGGGATLVSYGNPVGATAAIDYVPSDHITWAENLPLLYTDEHRLFVHAGVQPGVPLEEQDEQKLIWMLYPDGAEDGYADFHVVHGHHQFEEGPLLLKGRTDLDTLAWWTGRLVIGVFDDAVPGGPVDTLEVIGPDIEEIWAARAAA